MKTGIILPVMIAGAALVFHSYYGRPFLTPKLVLLSLLLGLACLRSKSLEQWRPGGALLLLWPLFGWFWAVNAFDFMESLALWSFYALALFARPLDEHLKTQMTRGLTLAGCGVTGYLIVQKLGMDPHVFVPAREAGSFMGNLNTAAHFLLLGLCLGNFRGVLRFAGPAILILGIFVSGSRGAMAGLLLLAFLRCPAARRRTLALLALVGVCLLSALFYKDVARGARYLAQPETWVSEYKQQPHLIAERDPWFHGKRLSLMTRLILYRNSLHLALDSGPAGTGMGQFEVHYPRFANAAVEDINLNQEYRARSAHNLILDAVIQLGLPWCLLAGWLAIRFYRATHTHKVFWTAVAVQLPIAMVSLNYLNPLVVAPLLLLAPTLPTQPSGLLRRFACLPLLLLLGAYAWLDVSPFHEYRIFFPERRAARHHMLESVTQAWFWQVSAWKQDPYGPETLTNMGTIALRRAQQDPTYTLTGIACYAYCVAQYPNYGVAQTYLEQQPDKARSRVFISAAKQNPKGFHRALRTALQTRKPFVMPSLPQNQ